MSPKIDPELPSLERFQELYSSELDHALIRKFDHLDDVLSPARVSQLQAQLARRGVIVTPTDSEDFAARVVAATDPDVPGTASLQAALQSYYDVGISHGYHAVNGLWYNLCLAAGAWIAPSEDAFLKIAGDEPSDQGILVTAGFHMKRRIDADVEGPGNSLGEYCNVSQALKSFLERTLSDLTEQERRLLYSSVVIGVELAGYLGTKFGSSISPLPYYNPKRDIVCLCPPPARYIRPLYVVDEYTESAKMPARPKEYSPELVDSPELEQARLEQANRLLAEPFRLTSDEMIERIAELVGVTLLVFGSDKRCGISLRVHLPGDPEDGPLTVSLGNVFARLIPSHESGHVKVVSSGKIEPGNFTFFNINPDETYTIQIISRKK